METKLLLDNAYEAWMDATGYAWALHNGVMTLGYKKKFVSALHNSVELFVKQIMLDDCDYRVATVRKMKSKSGEPVRSYLNSNDLNEYFTKLSKKEREEYYTIEFKELIGVCCDIMSDYSADTRQSLELLQRLRNNETHFFIDKSDYLNDLEFEKLYNFMIDFYDLINMKKDLFPNCFEGRSFGVAEISFDTKKIHNFSFENCLASSEIAVLVKEVICERGGVTGMSITNALALAYDIWNDIKEKEKELSFDYYFPFVQSLFESNLIEFIDLPEKDENGMPEYTSNVIHRAILKY